MSIITEGVPEQIIVPVSKDVEVVAANAKDELSNIELSGKQEFSTRRVSNFKHWLEREALQDPSSAIKLEEALKKAHFLMEDEKASVKEKVVDISMMLDEFITNPTEYKAENPSNFNMLIDLCEALSE